MKQSNNHESDVMRTAGGFTLLELVVAMVVLGIALTGLFPLVAVMSRELQPVKTVTSDGHVVYHCRTPARDGNTSAVDFPPPWLVYERHTWYLTAAGDVTATNDPNTTVWVRKLGASAQFDTSPPTGFTSSTTPIPVQPSVVICDDSQLTDSGNGIYYHETIPANWNPGGASQGFYGTGYRSHPILSGNPTGADNAIWTFKVSTTGWYSIQATWPAATDQASDAQYSVFVQGAAPPSPFSNPVQKDQRNAPVGITDTDSPAHSWENLTTVPILLHHNDTVTVQLNGESTTGAVVADAVRIVQNEVKIKSIDRSLADMNSNSGDADVTVHVSVTVNLPE